MITEDYVSFELSKLLKEKGFDWFESPFYSEQDRDEWRQNNSYTIPNVEYDPDIPFDSKVLTMVAPHVSIQMAMKWLREVYKLYVVVKPYITEDGILSLFDVKSIKEKDIVANIKTRTGFNSYEEACEAAIKYCLENLI